MRKVTKLVCPLCKQEISKSNFTKHQRRHENHPETFLDKEVYHLDHEGLNCKYCGKLCKNKNSLVQHEIRCGKNPSARKTYREIKGFNNKGRAAWNKGLTKETDERVAKGSITYQQNKALGKHKDTTGENNVSKRPDVVNKISLTCLDKSKNGTWHKSLAKNMHYNYNGIDLDGKWELYYAIYLDSNNINWERCNKRFKYIFEDSIHYYTPDFYIIDTDEYIEIKGYETAKDRVKWNQFPKELKLIILKEKDLKELDII